MVIMNALYSTDRFTCRFFLVLILLLMSTNSFAAIVASVSSNKVAKGEVFLLKVISDQRLSSDDIDFSSLKDDFFIGTPNFGMSINSINGKSTMRSEWNLSLAPLRAGILTIPSFTTGNDQTDSIYVTVTVDPDATNQDDLVEWQVKLNRNEIYPGELAQLATRLIIKTDPRRLQDAKIQPPSATGDLGLEPVGESKQYKTVVDGIEVTIVDQAYHVTANQSGAFTVYGPKLTGTIFDQNSRTGTTQLIPIDMDPANIELTVLAKPTNLSGNWLPSQKLTLEQTWQDENGNDIDGKGVFKTQVGTPLTRIIRLSVSGVTQSQLPDINIDYPNSVRLYPENAKFEQIDDVVVMTVKHVIIAKSEGNVTLPAASLNWWNTQTKSSATANIDALTLDVKQSDVQTVSIATNQQPPLENSSNNQRIEVEIKDAGFWPYLTITFAILWLVFFILWIKNRQVTLITNTDQVAKESDTLKRFERAVNEEDGVKIQATINQWLDENPDIDLQLKQDIHSEIQSIMRSIYTTNRQKWDKKKIIVLVKEANRKRAKQPASNVLAEL